MSLRRIVVLVTDVEYKEIKRAAGIASMSAYIKSRVLEAGDGIPEGHRTEKVQQADDKAPEAGNGDIRTGGTVGGKCVHRKERGELCYKCDPKFGKPEIG